MTPPARIALVADVFPPLRSSGAVQMRDLAQQFARQGFQTTVMIPAPELDTAWRVEYWEGVQVIRLKAPKTKDVGYVRRTLGEFLMPFFMMRNLKKSELANVRWDGVVWYSPTIFLGPLARFLKKASGCRAYLIVRDIFPEWAVDMGIMRRALPYYFFKLVERYQYSVADVIGVQTPGNVVYLDAWARKPGRQVEVLQNWLAESPARGCSIRVSETALAGRTIFVYAGNMGIAQGMGRMLDLAAGLRARADIGFLFVGRGTDARRLREDAAARGLDNVAFFDEIDPSEIAGLYEQCHIGLVALDRRHKTHNIPGKFLSYMQSGLPVLASINAGNDLAALIDAEAVGKVTTDSCVDTLVALAQALADQVGIDQLLAARCRALARRMFAPGTAVKQILQAVRVQAGQVVDVAERQPSAISSPYRDEFATPDAGFEVSQS